MQPPFLFRISAWNHVDNTKTWITTFGSTSPTAQNSLWTSDSTLRDWFSRDRAINFTLPAKYSGFHLEYSPGNKWPIKISILFFSQTEEHRHITMKEFKYTSVHVISVKQYNYYLCV
ncbi:hypothetical protein LSH36_233g05029 [Paralvinella palmiformis]|uniref:Uncharacterized protein n=1 Tax=Paralvinella palmiformis TaxID=53620 RepID=A0AAD9N647_9ANNE|nr:hypothetical protein LSH36_233g05029 [Paralvinella palmiformis]